MSIKKTIESTLNFIIVGILAFCVFSGVLGATTFMLSLPEMLRKAAYFLLWISVLAKAVVTEDKKQILIAILIAAGYVGTYVVCGHQEWMYFALFTVGLTGIHWKKILGAYVAPASLILFSMMFASLSGAIHNFIGLGRGTRSSWGNCNTTEFVSAIVFLLIFTWVYFKNIPDLFFLVPGTISLVLAAFVARGKTATTLSILFLIFVIYKSFEDRLAIDDVKKLKLKKATGGFLCAIFPILFALMIALVYMYNLKSPIALKFDDMSHHRIIYAAKMLERLGVKPFGNAFEMSGNGWSNFGTDDYTFIDSSFPLLLIRFGIVTTLVASAAWIWLTTRVVKAENKRMAFVMFLIALDCVSEQHFVEINYNLLLVMPFAFLDMPENNRNPSLQDWLADPDTKRFRTAQFATIAGLAVILGLLSPVIFSYYRTIFNGLGMTDGYAVIAKKQVFIISVCTVLVVSGFVWFMAKLIATRALTKTINRKYFVLTVTCAVIMLIGVTAGDSLVGTVSGNLLGRMVPETEVISKITVGAKGKVYADRFPEAYRRQFPGIGRSFLDGEDLSRLKNTTVIVDADDDSNMFSGMGFLYLQISNDDAIYTNDEGVIAALQNEGYVLRGYNYKIHDVDLGYLASINGLERQEDGSVLVKGKDHSLVFGPYLELYSGQYSMTYKLKLPEEMQNTSADSLGTLRVSANWGKKIYSEYEITKNKFDENGELVVDISFTGGSAGYEFLIFMKDDNSILLQEMTYGRTPKYDRHIRVNNLNQAINEKYYDFDGKPYMLTSGQYGAEYEYDDDENCTITRYLGIDGKAIMITSGYAEIHRTFDEDKLVTSESYYGTEGEPMLLNNSYFKVDKTYNDINQLVSESYFGIDEKPILTKQGYAKVEREYDGKGNVTSLSYYDTEGNPTIINSVYHRILRNFNSDNLVTREAYYGTDGKLTYNSAGISVVEREYDEHKWITSEWYLDVDEKPCFNTSGVHRINYDRDSAGRVILETYVDENGQKIYCTGGYCGVQRTYDTKGNQTMFTYLDADGNPVINTARVASYQREFDENNRLVSETYLDTEGNVTLSTSKVAGCRYAYNEKGQTVKYTYFDEKGFLKNNSSGYAILKREYDKYNRLEKEIYCDKRGNPVSCTNASAGNFRIYDEFNRTDTFFYIDLEGNNILNTSGYAQIKYVYDEFFYTTEEHYLDTDGNPVLNTSLYAGVRREHFKRRTTKEVYLDTEGNITAISNGSCGQLREYDKYGNNTRTVFIDEKGDPVLNTSGYASIVREFDAARNCIAEYFYDVDGKPINTTSGYSELHRVYDRDRNATETTKYDVDGNQV